MSENDPKIRIGRCQKYTPYFGTSPYGHKGESPPGGKVGFYDVKSVKHAILYQNIVLLPPHLDLI